MANDGYVDILLEVSARLNDPDTFYQGDFFDIERTRYCTVGHVLKVCSEIAGIENIMNFHHGVGDSELYTKYSNIVGALNKKVLEVYPGSTVHRSVASVNDTHGRVEAKSIVDKVIEDLKDCESLEDIEKYIEIEPNDFSMPWEDN